MEEVLLEEVQVHAVDKWPGLKEKFSCRGFLVAEGGCRAFFVFVCLLVCLFRYEFRESVLLVRTGIVC